LCLYARFLSQLVTLDSTTKSGQVRAGPRMLRIRSASTRSTPGSPDSAARKRTTRSVCGSWKMRSFVSSAWSLVTYLVFFNQMFSTGDSLSSALGQLERKLVKR